MDTGELLLLAVLRSHGRDPGAVAALVDCLQESLPGAGGFFAVTARLVKRFATIEIARGSFTHIKGIEHKLLRVTVKHYMGRKGYRQRFRILTDGEIGGGLTEMLSKGLRG